WAGRRLAGGAQGEGTPDAVAVQDATSQLTYAARWAAAGARATRLQAAGVRAETAVGVVIERSVAWAVALLGVWRAGGVYLPLDGQYAADRLAWMVGYG